MLDLSTGKSWIDMTNAERAALSRNTNNLVWAGQRVTNVVPSVLNFGLRLEGRDPVIPSTEIAAAACGPTLGNGPKLTGYVVAPDDGGGPSFLGGCEPFPATGVIPGNIVLVDRGSCTFVTKTLNAHYRARQSIYQALSVPVRRSRARRPFRCCRRPRHSVVPSHAIVTTRSGRDGTPVFACRPSPASLPACARWRR